MQRDYVTFRDLLDIAEGLGHMNDGECLHTYHGKIYASEMTRAIYAGSKYVDLSCKNKKLLSQAALVYIEKEGISLALLQYKGKYWGYLAFAGDDIEHSLENNLFSLRREKNSAINYVRDTLVPRYVLTELSR